MRTTADMDTPEPHPVPELRWVLHFRRRPVCPWQAISAHPTREAAWAAMTKGSGDYFVTEVRAPAPTPPVR